MSRVPGDAKRGWSAGQPRPNTARAELDAAWRKLSPYDQKRALKELAASVRASRRGREGDG
jgi:hypothetical protein